MSFMSKPFQFVTLVSRGGTPVTIADQTGAPYPTTGEGALVFNREPELFNPLIHDAEFTGSFPSPLSDLGDLYYHDATSDTRLPMGDPGTFLQAQADGLHWVPQGTGGTLPPGGASGQILTKASGTDFDAIWSTPSGGGGGGGGAPGNYNTALDVTTSIVPAVAMFVTTQGYANIGDGGQAQYVRTGTTPPANHLLYLTDLSGQVFEIFSNPIPVRAANAKGDGIRNPVDGSYSGTSDATAIKNWIQACIAKGYDGWASPGNYLIDIGDLVGFDNFNGLRLRGVPGKTVFVHQIGHPAGERGFKSMIRLGRVAQDAPPSGPVPDSYVNYVGENASGIVTTANCTKGVTTVIPLNTLAITPLTTIGVTRNLQVGDHITMLDTQQPVPYRGGKITAITNITQSNPCIITAPGHDIDPDDPDGEVLPVFGVNGMVEINNHSYQMIASPDFPDLLTLPNLDSTTFAAYASGGQIGTGGISGYLSQVNRIIAVDNILNTITLQTPVDFSYLASTRIGVWWNPLTDFVWEGIDIAYDQVKSYRRGVVAALKIDNCIGTRVSQCNIDYATSRIFTFENSIYGTLDKCISTFTPGIAANLCGIQRSSAYWNVTNNIQEGGAHIAQIGSGFDITATSHCFCYGNTGWGTGSILDTHWNARNIAFKLNKAFAQANQYAQTTKAGAGMTQRGWYQCTMTDNEIYGFNIGANWHQGGAMGGNVCTGNLFHCCRQGLRIQNSDRLSIIGNRFINSGDYGMVIYATSGPAQGHTIFTEMKIKANTFIGPSSVAAVFAQFNQQPVPMDPKDWELSDFDITGNPANDFVGSGDMAGVLQYYIGGRTTEPGAQAHGPWYPLALTTGALTATMVTGGITAPYRPGEIVTLAGGTSTRMATLRLGNVTLTNVILAAGSAGHGFKVGDTTPLVGGVIVPTALPNITATYDTVTGLITATFTSAHGITVPSAPMALPWITLASVFGTGGFATLTGSWPVTSITSPTVLVMQGPTGAGASTITSATTSITKEMLTVTSITPQTTVDGVDYGGINGFLVSAGVNFSSLPGGDIFGVGSIFRPAPPGGNTGVWRSVQAYTVGQGAYYQNVAYVCLANNTNQPPATSPTFWKLYPPNASQARVQATNYVPTGTLSFLTPGAYTATPPNPVGQQSTTGSGFGIQFNVTWSNGTLLDVATSPRDLIVTTTGGIVDNLGPAQNIHRVIRLGADTTIKALNGITPPGGVDQFFRAGWIGEVYGDAVAGTWRFASQLSSIADVQYSLQSTFPTAPGAGFVREWYSADGRQLRQASDGRNRFIEAENDRVYRATPQNGSRDYTMPARVNALTSATYNAAVALPTFTGTYNNSNGQITLTFSSAHNIGQLGQWVNLSALTGTGGFAGCNGTWQVITITSATVVVVQGTATLGATTITGGTAVIANQIVCTMAFASPLAANMLVTLFATNGTGAYTSLNGTWPVISVAGSTVTLSGPNGVAASTITGGTLSLPQMTQFLANVTAAGATGLNGALAPTLINSSNGYANTIHNVITAGTWLNASMQYESIEPIYLNKSGRISITFALDGPGAGLGAAYYFVGLKTSGILGIGSNPTTNVANLLGVGINGNQTTLRQIHGDATTPSTSTDLGANFPSNTIQSDIYEFSAWWAAGAPIVFWQVVRWQVATNTFFVATGTFTTEIPDINTPLFLGYWSQNTNTGLAVALAHFDATYSVR